MDRTKVESSQIHSIGYDKSSQVLEVAFLLKGQLAIENPNAVNVYQYHDVSPELHAKLLAAESIGSFFYHEIRGPYKDKTDKVGMESVQLEPPEQGEAGDDQAAVLGVINKRLETVLANFFAAGLIPASFLKDKQEFSARVEHGSVAAELTLVVESIPPSG